LKTVILLAYGGRRPDVNNFGFNISTKQLSAWYGPSAALELAQTHDVMCLLKRVPRHA
jgi:hypothetical protein